MSKLNSLWVKYNFYHTASIIFYFHLSYLYWSILCFYYIVFSVCLCVPVCVCAHMHVA